MHKRGLLTLMAALGIVLSGCSGSSGNDLATPANVSTPTVESSPTPKLTVEAEEEDPALNCTPGYDPCLPPASDYDCQGGSGNGPAYTGRVNVTGPDIYGLDRDGDGVGCE